MPQETILITSPLEDEQVARIRAAVPPHVEVVHDADLLPRPRFVADHKGPDDFARTPEEEARWRAHLARATILWDFPAGAPDVAGLALAPNVRWVQTTSSGVGQLVRNLGLADSDLLVTTARGVHARPLAEFAMMALLVHAKRYAFLKAEQAAHRWERYCGDGLAGMRMLIVGAGKIGVELTRLAHAFDIEVAAIVRNPSPERAAALGIRELHGLDRLGDLVPTADVIVLTAPHTPATEGIIDRATIARMKPGVVFVNIARGSLVDEPALIEALEAGRIGFAALDVAAIEPLPAASPLWDMPNVLVSPHSASTVAAENAAITDIFCHNCAAYFDGRREAMINVLDKQAMY